MNLNKSSKEFKAVFLMAFTKELIKNTRIEEFFELEKIINGRKKIKNKSETLAYLEKKYGKLIPSMVDREKNDFQKFQRFSGFQEKNKIPVNEKILSQKLKVPQFSQESQLDLWKLNSLIQDINVLSIVCNGSEENLLVKGSFGTRQTNIILSKDEIGQILGKFSEATKIPIYEGIFKVAFGGLTISAIISDVVGSKFIIRKIGDQRF